MFNAKKYLKHLSDELYQSLMRDSTVTLEHAMNEEEFVRLNKGISFIEAMCYQKPRTTRFFSRIKNPKYEVGDVVFIHQKLTNVNWRVRDLLELPFLVISTPLGNDKYNMYTIQVLNEEFLEPIDVHESFLKIDRN